MLRSLGVEGSAVNHIGRGIARSSKALLETIWTKTGGGFFRHGTSGKLCAPTVSLRITGHRRSAILANRIHDEIMTHICATRPDGLKRAYTTCTSQRQQGFVVRRDKTETLGGPHRPTLTLVHPSKPSRSQHFGRKLWYRKNLSFKLPSHQANFLLDLRRH